MVFHYDCFTMCYIHHMPCDQNANRADIGGRYLGNFRFTHCQSYDRCSSKREGSKGLHKRSLHMIPDSNRIPPLNELLQRFHGAHYRTSIDFSQEFLQILLKRES
jgi:hypothetical protein